MNPYKTLLRRVAHAQVEHPYLTLFLVAALTLLFLGGAGQVRTVAALEKMMPPGLEEIDAFNTLRDEGRGQEMIAIVVERDPESTVARAGILDYDVYEHVERATRLLEEEQDILTVRSLATLLEGRNGGPVSEEEFGRLVADPANHAALSAYVNGARTNTLILATTDVSANDERMGRLARTVKQDMESVGRPPGVRHQLTGTPIIQQELGRLIASDRRTTQAYSTLFVFLIVMLIFGTVTSAIVPIAVVTISVTWLYGTMGYTGLPISTLAGGVAAMVIGIGIDYAIHLMNRFKYERKKGRSQKEAIEEAVTDTGVATTGAAITTILAFLAFLTGAMPEMHRFGLLMSIGVGYSFLLTISALPAMLIAEERLFYWLKGHLHFGIEGEYYLATKGETCPPDYVQVKKEDYDRICAELKERFAVYKQPEKATRGKKATRPGSEEEQARKGAGQGAGRRGRQ